MQITCVTAASTRILEIRDLQWGSNRTKTEENDLIFSYAAAAEDHIATITNRALLESVWDYEFDSFPDTPVIWIPKGKLKSGTLTVYYTPDGGSEQTFSATNYEVATGGDKGVARVVLKPNGTWPTDTLRSINGVRIRFTAGWPDAASVPTAIKRAVIALVDEWYKVRELAVGNIQTAGPVRSDEVVRPLLRPWILEPVWIRQ